MHAIAALLLHHALLAVHASPAQTQAWQARVDALSATLCEHPQQHAAFERRWRRAR